MDSLTQIVLGAACGEVVLGKKVGNKAMLWGAVGGTIPDLDVVVGKIFMEPMNALAFHRGFMHSFLFAFTMPILLGFVVHWLYSSKTAQNKYYKYFFSSLWILFSALLWYGINLTGSFSFPKLLISSILLGGMLVIVFKRFTFYEGDFENTSFKEWYWLFFWSIFTHPILDSCTAYGTQLFQPFSDYRVAWNNISVADPLYTLPFLICLIIASYYTRHSGSRAYWNWLGIGISSVYMLWTVTNKLRVDTKFEESLANQGISYQRYTVTPSIFNNIYWQGVAEGDTAFYYAGYSFLDKSSCFENFETLPKNHDLIATYKDHKDVKIIKWFSNNYFNVYQKNDSTFQINDLRYGTTTGNADDTDDFIFKFHLVKSKDQITVFQKDDKPSDQNPDDLQEMMKKLWAKILGE